MKKWCLIFFLLPTCAQAMCLQFYNDKNGQSHAVRCGQQMPEVECKQKGDFYWDGQTCREIEPIKNCKAQGGEWYEVQIRYDMSINEVLNNPENTLSGGFKNVCICPKYHFWNGVHCAAEAQTAADKKCRLEVWCEKKRSKIRLLITPETLGATKCPQ